ncbi:MAG: 2-oxo acid dehydrogenase subunit E2 [Xanthomonadaceae bacterium]|jgi:pyruvate dehydrogenase E2 component (dihydrolipoamide acetyltransferase)|nr:2-oxo acid dehydrogenase subunit E2 [Xanthomonadaceae bacterium]
MSTTQLFLLPDLGEGLPDAEIVEWHVAIGQVVRLDEPLVSMETAKAVVEVPSPCSGTLLRVAGKTGDVIATGSWLAEFQIDPALPQRSAGQGDGHGHAPAVPAAATPAAAEAPPSATADTADTAEDTDAGTVVGAMAVSSEIRREAAVALGGIRAMPAVRALAKKLGVDLAGLVPSGADGVVTLADVRRAAEAAKASSPGARPSGAGTEAAFDVDAPIRGVRRNMLRSMATAHAEVVPTTLMDDADLHAWAPGEDLTARLVRALVVASRAEPAMNAWLDAKAGTLRRHARVDVGLAIDHPDGLFVATLRNAEDLDAAAVRAGIQRLRAGLDDRSLPPEALGGATVMLSNFGRFAGKYATPVVVPPCVCIVAAGRVYPAVVPVLGGIETHRLLPLSLTFDHRAATGGEAARFLKALLEDLQRPR